jgi:glycerophosphoryl diester phosphodiesterase
MLVLGHRGALRHVPENTLAAFEFARRMGADGIETDVRVTRDGVPIALHDPTVDRTTDGTGAVRRIPWSELGRLDAGSWFGPEFAGQRIPRIGDLLDEYAGRIYLCLEVKTPAAVAPLVELLTARSLDRAPDLAVISFSGALVSRLRRALPALSLGRLVRRVDERTIRRACADRVEELYVPARCLQTAAMAHARERGVRVVVWDVKSVREVVPFRELGLAGAIVDDLQP